MSIRRAHIALACALVVLAAAGCGESDKTLSEPRPGATAPVPTSATTQPPVSIPTLVVSSPVIPPGGSLPAEQTCDGAGTSPPFEWSGVPVGTVELVLVVTNPAEEFFVHWFVAGLDPAVTGIAEGTVPLTAVEGPNSAGGFGWTPPCPGLGEQAFYEVALYALTTPLELDVDLTADEARARLTGTPANLAVMSAGYTRAG